MWWNDNKEIKKWMILVQERLFNMEQLLGALVSEREEYAKLLSERFEHIQHSLSFSKDGHFDSHKYEEYMKNVDKLNGMINELKGCAALARSAVVERKKEDAKFSDSMRNMIKSVESLTLKNSEKIKSMDKIIEKIAKKIKVCEKKSPKKKKPVTQKSDLPAA
jgi:hypothetical protein